MPELESMGSTGLALAAVALLLAAAAGLGSLVVGSAATRHWPVGDAGLLRLVVGLNLLALVGAVLGQTRLLAGGRSVWLLAGLGLLAARVPCIEVCHCLAAAGNRRCERRRRHPAATKQCGSARGQFPHCLTAAGRTFWRLFKRSSGGCQAVAHGPSGAAGLILHWAGWLPGLGLLALAVVTLGPALSYPTGWDELVYHQVLPRRWLAQGSLAFYPDLPYSGFPSLGEILFWLMAPVESVIAPRLLNWVCWILGLVCLSRLLRRRLASAASLVVTLAFALSNTALLISANCYVETILMMDVAGLLLAAALMRRCGVAAAPWARAAILGVLAGGAAAVKLTGIAAIAIPCLWYVGRAWRNRSRWRAQAGELAACLTVALAVCLPFYLRPWLATGNPFYPFFCEWFTSDPVRIEMSRHHHVLGGWAFGVRSVAAFVDGPLLLAFRPGNYDGEFGWQFAALVVLAIVALASARRPRVRRVLVWPAAVSLCLYVFWFITAQQARFAVPFVLSFVTLAAVGLQLLHGGWRRLVLAGLVAATLASVPWRRLDYYRASWLTVAGSLSRTDYVHNVTDRSYLPLVQAIHACTPANARLMLLFEHRGFYMPRTFVIGTPVFQEGAFSPPERFTDAASVMEVLVRERITHVITARVPVGPDRAPDWAERQEPFLRGIAQCVQQGNLRPVWQSETHLLLEVR